jgi:hypothetical protein
VESDTVMTQLSSLSWAYGTANKLPCIEDNSRETIGLQRSGCSAVLSHRYECVKEQINPRRSNRRPTEGTTHSIASSEHLADMSVYKSCSTLKVWKLKGLSMTVRLSSYLSGKHASLITSFAATNLCHECQLVVQRPLRLRGCC